jgi:hypothetical protein
MSSKQELIEWASLAGLRLPSRSNHFFIDYRMLDQLLEHARAEEREACAAICDEEKDKQAVAGNSWWATTNCAEAIRARGKA